MAVWRFVKKIAIALVIVFLVVSFLVIIKNKLDLTKKEDRAAYWKGIGEFGKNFFKNLVKVTAFAIKQEWIPSTKEINKTNASSNKIF
jgi:uncharacterized alpha/beta hydrolase family protein